MKFATATLSGNPEIIASLDGTKAVRLSDVFTRHGLGDGPRTMQDLIDLGMDKVRSLAAPLTTTLEDTASLVDMDAITWLPPQPRPSKILGVAFNNMGIRKAAHVDPGVPNFFLKAPSSLIGHNQAVVIRSDYGETIPELELAGVIGRRLKDASREEAQAAVFGYSIINDVTSHGLKFGKDSIATTREKELIRPHHLGWRNRRGPDDNDVYFVYHTRSKASDTFGPMGPWITFADAIADPDTLDVTGWLNGEEFARDNTSSYRFKIGEVIAEASRYFTLEPGDIFCFGTSARGVGRFKNGHRDVNLSEVTGTLDIEIAGLGRLSHTVRHE